MKYLDPKPDYFVRRNLKPTAGVWSLWGLGVGAVISGNFFGWNFGLGAGGFGGMAGAVVLLAFMYFFLIRTMSELAAAMPHAGGAYGWCRAGLGPVGGVIAGFADNLKYVLIPAVIIFTLTNYLDPVADDWLGISLPNPVWWAILYLVFTGINIASARLAFVVAIILSLLSLTILAVFWAGALAHLDFSEWALNLDINGEELFDGAGPLFPFGIAGIGAAIPFAIWFFLGIEQIPLAGEETVAPEQTIPRALKITFATLVVAAVLTLILVAGMEPGAAIIGVSNEPLFAGFEIIFEYGISYAMLAFFGTIGLVVSFHAMLFACGRNIFALSRAGYLPKFLSLTFGRTKTPVLALIAGSALGFLACVAIEFSAALFGGLPVGTILLNMAVFGAVIGYIMQSLAYLKLRQMGLGQLTKTSSGKAGALVALGLALLTLLFLWLNEDYRPGLIGCVIWIGAGLLHFGIHARYRLVKSPEEEFALMVRENSKS